jgi:microcystin-dependent protein
LEYLTLPWLWEDFGDLSVSDCTEAIRDMLDSYYGGNPLLGTIQAYVLDTLPEGTLVCDGTTHSFDDYPALLGKLSSALDNGDGTFTVPDLTEYFLRGGGVDDIGATGGSSTVSLSSAQNGAHTHTIQYAYGPDVASSVVLGVLEGFQATPTEETTSEAGQGAAHENRPPFYSVVFALVAA